MTPSPYDEDIGYQLFLPTTFTPEVATYRCAERRLLGHILTSHSTVVELGCGKGENLLFVRERGLAYVGVDPSQSYIREAEVIWRNWLGASCSFIVGSADSLADWEPRVSSHPPERVLFMPFNCLGNVADVEAVVDALSRTPATVVVSVFNDAAATLLLRQRYYLSAGFDTVERRSKWGTVCVGPYGFRSTGFDEKILLDAFYKRKYKVRAVPLTPVAFAIVGRTPATLR
ncbi:MAG: methyltransferase domain-containing protein [Proteobacteria bacterium]|nr:methyltransferase domain-containing protein [Pseudomonadota bacterium]